MFNTQLLQQRVYLSRLGTNVVMQFARFERGTDKSPFVQSVIQEDGGVEWDWILQVWWVIYRVIMQCGCILTQVV